ncbi:MAG: 3-hydroxyacyl-CoA dehydrogenase family protein [Polyangiales bacterium]|nr:3-hydroxyacyl-CoA dehydrogenase family protein [Myxococcales bacterium]
MADAKIQNVAVIGAGTMGHGIAQVCAVAGLDVHVADPHPGAVDVARDRVDQSLAKLVSKGGITPEARRAALERLAWTTDPKEAAGKADLVIEAAPERLELKIEIFRDVDAAAPAHAIFASNTSSLSVTAMAKSTSRPGRFIGMHFFNPVPLMALLELVRAETSDDATVDAALAFAKRIGKEPIVVRDVPGFASSRLGVALGAEAIRMLEAGVASAEDIDKAMELGYRHPMGPLKLTDLVGLDVRLAILEHLTREVGPQFEPPELLRRMVKEGKLGRKTGEGFYKYEK